MSTNLAATRAAPGVVLEFTVQQQQHAILCYLFFYLKTKQAKTHTHTLTQNVKQKHCLVVRKSSSQEEATTLGEVSPDKLRGRGHSRQIPHSSSSSKRVLLPLFISKKKTCHGRQSYSRVFSPNRLNQSLETHTRTLTYTQAALENDAGMCPAGTGTRSPGGETGALKLCVCEKKLNLVSRDTNHHHTKRSHTWREREKTHTQNHTHSRESERHYQMN